MTLNYPQTAGHQGGDTDRLAANKIEASGRAATLREKVERLLAKFPRGLTADDAANLLGEDLLSIRPRFTQLKQIGILYDTGNRRKTVRGGTQRILAHRKYREGSK